MGNPATVLTVLATALFVIAVSAAKVQAAPAAHRFRYIVAFGYVLWFYKAIELIVPALGAAIRDQALLDFDNWMCGQTPSLPVQAWTTTALNELFSGCYLTYLVYLHVCVIHSWFMPIDYTRRFANWLYSVYAIGLAGYMIYPAVGPENAFPQLFGPDLEGPLLTPLNRVIVQNGSSVYDAFPSLHVLVTLSLLEFDRQYLRRRFYWMLLPAAGVIASTIYLRYHYAADLIAGGLLFVAAKILFGLKEPGDVDTGDAP